MADETGRYDAMFAAINRPNEEGGAIQDKPASPNPFAHPIEGVVERRYALIKTFFRGQERP